MSSLTEIAKLFLKLGTIGFGGPAAHIAMMQDEVVRKRRWMDDQHFLDLISATNLIPGPNSTEMAIHIGKERGGWKGLVVAGLCFILPAVLITGAFAWFYKTYGQLPEAQRFIYGIKPAIIAVILAAVYPLAKTSLKTTRLRLLGLLALILALAGINEILILFGTGILALMLSLSRKKGPRRGLKLFSVALPVTASAIAQTSNWSLFLSFLKIGSILYGSGYVLFAFLDTELVATGLLSRQQLIDAIAVGQFTPGPVFSSVTFIGYQIGGVSGAVVATIGIFLPSFLFVALLNPLVRKLRRSPRTRIFLDAVNVASIALIAAISYEMGLDSITDWRTVVIAILSLIVVFGFRRINSALLVIGGSALGYLLSWI